MRNWGIPYVGSKSRIAEWVVDTLPSAPVLVDLFAGGCTEVASIESRSTMNDRASAKRTERLMVQTRFFEQAQEWMRQSDNEGRLFKVRMES